MKELTEKQLKAFDFVLDYIKSNNMPPTLKELGEHLDVTPVAAADYLDALQKKGFISRTPGTRGIRLQGYRTELKEV